jgi:hypothetical protein
VAGLLEREGSQGLGKALEELVRDAGAAGRNP